MSQDETWMALALEQARLAALQGDIPVGCVIVEEGQCVAVGHNTRQRDNDPLGHAEINAIRTACQKLGSSRLSRCTLYVTLEPCCMCIGAILQTKALRLVYGAKEEKTGCVGSVCDITAMALGHTLLVKSGVLAEESRELLQSFFEKLRKE